MKELQVNKELPVIQMNFEEVRQSLEETMEMYKNIVVTEEGLKDCKATQKRLAGLRNDIEGYRKSTKREMEAPIKEFEGKCKELTGLISEVEGPIKEGIKEFDNKRKEEKKKKAEEIIKAAIVCFQLEDEYAKRIELKDSYLKLTGSIKSIKEDVEMQVMMLKKEQEDRKTKIQMLEVAVKNEIERANEKLNTKLDYLKFERYVVNDYPLDKILNEINKQADLIYKAENKAREEIKEEPRVELNQEKIIKPEKKEEPKVSEDKLFVEFRVEHNFKMIQALSQYLKANGYEYDVKAKGKVK
ncbi:DUF1351 domain-containing protein [Clostridium chrysemydis]|uniref:DUF1351 domain-containing protein n=1 Tax=Clostridium chrysemydis TaxID=2665504 RepID=UPI0018842C36|nr:DUF1351 domain-containing protein [Clostridium chrysemydis]